MTTTTAGATTPSVSGRSAAVPDHGRNGPGAGCGDPGPGAESSAVTVLPGGVRMRAPGHEPPPLPGPHVPAPALPAGVPAGDTVPEPPAAGSSVALREPVEVPADRDRVLARAAELARAVTEVLAGRRPPGHLAGAATPAVLRYLASARPGQPAHRSRPAGRGGRAGAPGCVPADAARRRSRLHVGHPHRDAAEVCTTVLVGGRIRALALRLDRADTGAPWALTAVRLV